MTVHAQHLIDALEDAMRERTCAADVGGEIGERGEQLALELGDRARRDRVDELFTPAEVMEHGRVREADIARDVLDPESLGADIEEASLGGIQDRVARLLGGEPSPGL